MTQVTEEIVSFQTGAMCHSETGETSQTKVLSNVSENNSIK